MNELLEFLEQNKALKKEKPLVCLDVIQAQKGLVQSGFPLLPKDFVALLKIYNGIQGEDGIILGIDLEDERMDIVRFNKHYNTSTQKVILGYDDTAFLVFDSQTKEYLLLDRTDGLALDDFLEDEFSSAIASVLHF